MKITHRTLPVRIPAGEIHLNGDLTIAAKSAGLVIFVHGSGSSRFSSRNRHVAHVLNGAGFSTLLADLLTGEEDALDALTAELRLDIPMLAQRTMALIDWASKDEAVSKFPIGLFGASTGAAAAIIAAVERAQLVGAVVSRGGRVDLAYGALRELKAPLMMIVGSKDEPLFEYHREAVMQLACEYRYVTIRGASHLFEEPGKLDEVAKLAGEWFAQHLAAK